jgi:broad specificity phosphatase PhoE
VSTGTPVPKVYLVRHAHAGNKADWYGPDLARPLSERGRRQASGLVARLLDYPVGRILSSPAARCRQTVEPLATQRGVAVEATGLLGVDAVADGVLELLGDPDLRHAVLCTHGELIGQVFGRLVKEGLDLPRDPRWPKGSTWVLGHADGQVAAARYLEPLSAMAEQPGRHC